MTNKDQVELLNIVGELLEITSEMAQSEHSRDALYYLSNRFDTLREGVSNVPEA